MILQGSVGKDGKNRAEDVELVQLLLKKAGVFEGTPSGNCDEATVAAIVAFQKTFVKHPDGRIDVGGYSWVKLSTATQPVKLTPPTTTPEWSGDSAKWTQEKKLASLDPVFRPKVEQILQALRDADFRPKIFFGWRSVQVQLELYRKGTTKVKFSFHNAQTPEGKPNAYAVDIVDERWGWEDAAKEHGFWDALGNAAKEQGCVWGGDWKDFPDVAHVQDKQNSELAAVKKASGL